MNSHFNMSDKERKKADKWCKDMARELARRRESRGKIVKVEAWAASPWNGKIENLIWLAGKKCGNFTIPCTITYYEKDRRQ